jgi:hypothetical protein
VAAIAWLVCGAMGTRAAGVALWRFPVLAQIVIVGIAVIVGTGGLIGYWLIADHVDYLRRGYRVRWIAGDQWLYEERISHDAERSLPFIRLILGKGYAALCEVRIQSEASWDSEAPPWAKGRRAEIAQRISHCFGGDQGGQIRFVDR